MERSAAARPVVKKPALAKEGRADRPQKSEAVHPQTEGWSASQWSDRRASDG